MAARMSDGAAPQRADDEAGLDKVDRFVLIFLRESTLWPILIVIVGHIVVFIAPVLLLATRDRRPSAMAMTVVLGWLSFSLVRFDRKRSGKLAQLSALALVVWMLAIATAVVAHWTGIF